MKNGIATNNTMLNMCPNTEVGVDENANVTYCSLRSNGIESNSECELQQLMLLAKSNTPKPLLPNTHNFLYRESLFNAHLLATFFCDITELYEDFLATKLDNFGSILNQCSQVQHSN